MPGEEGANRLTGWGRFLCNLEAEANYPQILDDLQHNLAKEIATLNRTPQTPWGCHNIHVVVNGQVSCIWCKNCGKKNPPTYCPHISEQWYYNLCQTMRCTAGKKKKKRTWTCSLAVTQCWTVSMWDRQQLVAGSCALTTCGSWTLRPLPPSGVKDRDNITVLQNPLLQ